jgi:hypothetical protein
MALFAIQPALAEDARARFGVGSNGVTSHHASIY